MKSKVIDFKSKEEFKMHEVEHDEERFIKNIVITYNDDSTKTVTKGAILALEKDGKFMNMSIELTNMQKKSEMMALIDGFAEFIIETGLMKHN